jgi:citrate synthase
MDSRLQKSFQDAAVRNLIPDELYHKYQVKKGLRNEDGTGVLIGLTRIADVVGYERDASGRKINCAGELYYRGIPIENLIDTVITDEVRGYEKICYLILFGKLPSRSERKVFETELASRYELPEGFLANNILRSPSRNVMNMIQRCLLMLYQLDPKGDNCSPVNTLDQGLSILAKMPAMVVYAYEAKAHFFDNASLIIHHVRPDYGIAENILNLIRPDGRFTREEAKLLDLVLCLHADHGSGNNSTFSNMVVASTGTDLYSAFSASVGSLKGPKHGGANITCCHMMKEVIAQCGYDASDRKIKNAIHKLKNREMFDQSGLIYGFGHAVYTLSDPRCELLKAQALKLAAGTEYEKKFAFYRRFEDLTVEMFRKEYSRDICANIDFYSGLVYELLGIPEDLYTPLFVASRSVGWLSHNIEDKLCCNRIVRPAGLYVGKKEKRIK